MSDRKTWEQAVMDLRKDPGKEQLVRECYFDDPLLVSAERFYKSGEWGEVRNLLSGKIPCRVLDVGAGRGITSYAFSRDGCEVTALEPDPSPVVGADAIRTLRSEAGIKMDIIENSGEQVPLPDSFFDIIYGRAVLHHIKDLSIFFKEVKRLLNKNGVFLFVREHVISRKKDRKAFLDTHPLHNAYGGESALLLKEYIDPIKSAGLKIAKVFGPFESPVNLYPRDRRDFERMVILSAARIMPFSVAARLGGLKWVQEIYGRFLSYKSHVPGRLFSFMGEKMR
jgi:SAM-dependent methyltransferase